MTDIRYDTAAAAYRRMAAEARYRPAAPSDGLGHVVGPLDLTAEARRYADRWAAEEREYAALLGVPDSRGREALIYMVEAARSANGMNFALARRLLELARDALPEIPNPFENWMAR